MKKNIFNDVKEIFKFRFYIVMGLLSLGGAIFLLWGLLFFYNVHSSLDLMHLLGFIYFLFALLIGGTIYISVIGSIIFNFKEFKTNQKVRNAFFKFSYIFIFSVVLSICLGRFVTHTVSKINVSMKNLSSKKIESSIITFRNEKLLEVKNISTGEEKSFELYPIGEGPLGIKVKFVDGSKNEKEIYGYFDQTLMRVYRLDLKIKSEDVQVLEVKK